MSTIPSGVIKDLPIHHFGLELEMFGLALKVEERDILRPLLHSVRHHRFSVDPGKRVLV